jgi:putative membrane protein
MYVFAVIEHGSRRIRVPGAVPDPRPVRQVPAADSAPIKVGLAAQVPGGLNPDTWVEVTGTYTEKSTKDVINDGIIPYLNVIDLRPVHAPGKQYES